MFNEQEGPSPEEMGINPEETSTPAETENEVQPGAEPQPTPDLEGSPKTREEFEDMKAAAVQELREKFGMEKTAGFKEALKAGDTAKAKAWLSHIEDNRDRFPQYNDGWFVDRKHEIAQAELAESFGGMKKTSDFRDAIASGDVQKARDWLQHIIDNRGDFPKYDDAWFEDRQKELEQA